MSEIASHRMLQTDQHWVDRLSTWFADRCSPILVKEARQAMKSWHFQWTFMMLLLAVVAWSFMGISIALFNDETQESGGMLMAGYMVILGFPLAIVLPLASFRSLAREFDDETIQLLSITTLSARRIVLGKLGSAALQMVIYMSAVVPCVAFSYLLRGIDLTQIAMLLLVPAVSSMSLCCLGLMLAGFARFNWLAILLNLALMAGVVACYFGWCGFNTEFYRAAGSSDMIFGTLMVLSLFIGTGYVAFECATSLISFPSEDRSSRIRVAISLQLLLAIAAFSAFMYVSAPQNNSFRAEIFVFGYSTCITHYLCLVGAMMVSEQTGMSYRVRRGLPTSLLGRLLWGLYVPGPGRGYLYALSGIGCWNLGILLLLRMDAQVGLFEVSGIQYSQYMPLAINFLFGTIYLTMVYLFMLFCGRWIKYGRQLVGALLVVVMYMMMAIITTTIDAFLFWDRSYYNNSWSGVAQHANWPYVLGRLGSSASDFEATAVVGSIGAIFLAMIGCGFALREWVISPVMVPQRVQDEDKRRAMTQAELNKMDGVSLK
ncbi:MAG: hypothetical protein JNL67_03330 [Planctomycetaceae bacterium]|nr:hypothetical protein [Planctomycetaceae bacterium]